MIKYSGAIKKNQIYNNDKNRQKMTKTKIIKTELERKVSPSRTGKQNNTVPWEETKTGDGREGKVGLDR